jgi:hypothetical protein
MSGWVLRFDELLERHWANRIKNYVHQIIPLANGNRTISTTSSQDNTNYKHKAVQLNHIET